MHSSKENKSRRELQNTPRACFSLVAYAKTVISQLKEAGIQIAEGISDEEFISIESSLSFSFPPDLRAILQEGLPTDDGFPNWRFASREQLRTLFRLPVLNLLDEVARGRLWCEPTWGPKPSVAGAAVATAKNVMNTAPLLVPVYKHFYLPCRPNMAGNPVFFLHQGKVRRCYVDLTEFFQRTEFVGDSKRSIVAAWAMSPRVIKVWTQLAEWASLQEFLEQQEKKLKEAGWTSSETKEMLAGCAKESHCRFTAGGLAKRVRSLGLTLLQAGWSHEEVSYSLGDVSPSLNFE
ncbi:uncharacterized protein LOC144702552 [Wolffia australiana]